MARLLEGKKVSGDFPTVASIDGPVSAVADRIGHHGHPEVGGGEIEHGGALRRKRRQAENWVGNNAVVSAKQMGWNTLVFLDAKSCHYIGNQDIEPVLKNVEDCVRIALTGRIEG